LGFGKNFTVKEGLRLSLRADFFNVFNRWAYPGQTPGSTSSNASGLNSKNPFATPQYGADGSIVNGFGFFGDGISAAGGNFAPRSGEFVARIQF
jgi:hypothetical protein